MTKTKKLLHIFLTYVIALFVVLAIVSDANVVDYEIHFLNSDTMYLPSIYYDIFKDGNSINTFHLNPAPNFFPDMGGALLIDESLFL